MSDNPIKTHRDGHVLEVTLDRPKANAIDLATSKIMGDIFAGFRDDPELRVRLLPVRGLSFFARVGILRRRRMGMLWMGIMGLVVLGVCKSFEI